jgi:hypothetical protein
MRKVAILGGAVGAAGLTLYTGRHNHSMLLIALFTIWVLLPFVALAWAGVKVKLWVAPAIAIGTLVVYAYVAFGPPRSQPAAAFLLVPALSWLLILAVILRAARVNKR